MDARCVPGLIPDVIQGLERSQWSSSMMNWPQRPYFYSQISRPIWSCCYINHTIVLQIRKTVGIVKICHCILIEIFPLPLPYSLACGRGIWTELKCTMLFRKMNNITVGTIQNAHWADTGMPPLPSKFSHRRAISGKVRSGWKGMEGGHSGRQGGLGRWVEATCCC